jgi:hypothetical protein
MAYYIKNRGFKEQKFLLSTTLDSSQDHEI